MKSLINRTCEHELLNSVKGAKIESPGGDTTNRSVFQIAMEKWDRENDRSPLEGEGWVGRKKARCLPSSVKSHLQQLQKQFFPRKIIRQKKRPGLWFLESNPLLAEIPRTLWFQRKAFCAGVIENFCAVCEFPCLFASGWWEGMQLGWNGLVHWDNWAMFHSAQYKNVGSESSKIRSANRLRCLSPY